MTPDQTIQVRSPYSCTPDLSRPIDQKYYSTSPKMDKLSYRLAPIHVKVQHSETKAHLTGQRSIFFMIGANFKESALITHSNQ